MRARNVFVSIAMTLVAAVLVVVAYQCFRPLP